MLNHRQAHVVSAHHGGRSAAAAAVSCHARLARSASRCVHSPLPCTLCHAQPHAVAGAVPDAAAAAPDAAASLLPLPSPPAVAAATTDALLAWMRQGGCEVQGVQLHYSQGADGQLCRELRASQELSPGDVLVSVPLSCTVHYRDSDTGSSLAGGGAGQQTSGPDSSSSSGSSSSSSSSSRAALRRLQAGVPTASDGARGAWQFKMALEVLYHACDASSPLAAYIATLPGQLPGTSTPQVAMLWPQQDLQQLQYGPLIGDAASQAFWLQDYSSRVLGQPDISSSSSGSAADVAAAFGGTAVTQERLGWALAVSMSRAFGFKQFGGYALAPLIDMADHSPASNAEVRFSADSRRVKLIANKQVPAGAPILLNYGSHDSANLLLSYGFKLPANAADRFRFALDLDMLVAAIAQFVAGELPASGKATDSLKQWQRVALQDLGLLPVAAGAEEPAADAASNVSRGFGVGPGGASKGKGRSERSQRKQSVTVAAAPQPTQQHQPPQQQQQQPLMVAVGGQPPVSGPLLAAVRVILALEQGSIQGKGLAELGDWDSPLSREHEVLVMKALVGVLTVRYKAFATSIQQDRAELARLQQQPQQQEVLAAERCRSAVEFRLGMKLLLERSTLAVLQRLKALA